MLGSFTKSLFVSAISVAPAEIGDKTQLLVLILAGRYKQPLRIIVAMLIATVLNHGLAAWLGVWLNQVVSHRALGSIVASAFIVTGLWMLLPDGDGEIRARHRGGAFVTTLVTYFLAEMGDKTQVATVILAAKYNAPLAVVSGTTLGVLLADIPVVFVGQYVTQKLPLRLVKTSGALIFIGLGAYTLLGV